MNGLAFFIGGGVVDDWDREAVIFGQCQGVYNMRQVVRGRDKVDVVGTLLLQLQKDVGQARGRDFLALHRAAQSLGNIPILAEYTSEVAAIKKDSAGAGTATDAGFLVIHESGAGCIERRGLSADAKLALCAVDAAVTWTESAIGKIEGSSHVVIG